MTTLIADCAVLDSTAAYGARSGVDITIEGRRIASVEASRAGASADRVIDGRDRLVMPGLVNAHTHSHENFAKATSDRLPLEPWLVEGLATQTIACERDYYLSAMIGCIEMLRSGTTSVIDHLGLIEGAGLTHLDAVMQAYQDSGMRAVVAPLFREIAYDALDARERGFEIDTAVAAERSPDRAQTRARLALFEHFFARWHGAADDRLRCAVGPSGVQWFSPALLHEYFDLAQQFSAGMHIHFMETRVQDQVVRKLYGKTAAAMLADERLLAPSVSLPHSVWITDNDVRRIAEHGAVPVHNPAANLRLGSGLAPIRKLHDAGVAPALGSDGAKSSDHQNMFGHLHLAALVHNLTFPEPDRWLSSREVVAMATTGGAAAMMRADALGRIAPGQLADITLLDLRAPELSPLGDAYHQLAYCELGRSVHTVIVDGAVVVEAGVIRTVDTGAILAEARDVVARRRAERGPLPDERVRSIATYLGYQQHILRTTTFEHD